MNSPGLLAGEFPTVLEPESIIPWRCSLGSPNVDICETDCEEKWAGWELRVRSGCEVGCCWNCRAAYDWLGKFGTSLCRLESGVNEWKGSTELARTVAMLAVELLERSLCTVGRSGGWREVVEELRLREGEGSVVGSFEDEYGRNGCGEK